MSRKSILDVIKRILKFLSNGSESSTRNISYNLNSRWETALKALEFLKEVNLVKERKGEIAYKQERLWSLK